MTWRYAVASDGTELRVWDHAPDPATDSPLTTQTNDGSGFTLPGDVLDVMRSEAESAQDAGNVQRWRDIHIRMAHRDIAEVNA